MCQFVGFVKVTEMLYFSFGIISILLVSVCKCFLFYIVFALKTDRINKMEKKNIFNCSYKYQH